MMSCIPVPSTGNAGAQQGLNTYDSTFGLSATTVKVVKPQGTACSDPQGWGVETDLDIQIAHAAAPGARIVLEAARSASLADLLGAAKDAYAKRGALVVSMSFGGSEFPGETGAGADGVFSTGNGRGVSFESRPAYQQGVGGRSRRGIPDVALVAHPNTGVTMYDKQAGGFLVVGGTSVSDYHDVTTGSAGGSCNAGTG